MAHVIYSALALADIDRLAEFLLAEYPAAALETARVITDAISVLERFPLVWRPAGEALRELVISRGKAGYLALCEYREIVDLVTVLAIRHQREAGYSDRGAPD